MELWIRTQDKKLLMKSTELRYNQKKENHSILAYDTKGDYRLLGIYKSKERALEVLDEIQEILKPKTIIKFNEKEVYDEKENMVISTLLPYETFDIKQLSTYVYEMPID